MNYNKDYKKGSSKGYKKDYKKGSSKGYKKDYNMGCDIPIQMQDHYIYCNILVCYNKMDYNIVDYNPPNILEIYNL